MTAVRFLLNGEPRSEHDASPSMTVLDWLRTRAQLTGTKEGCAEGDCGACTVVLGRRVNGSLQFQAVNSCLMMLPQIDNCAVLTVEGLATDGALHCVQQALVDAHATQCGFCTPGFVMAMFAFHHGGEPADDALIHEALAGNLCRCTGYRSIVEACRGVAQGPADRFVARASAIADALSALPACTDYRHGAQVFLMPPSLDALFAAMAQHPGCASARRRHRSRASGQQGARSPAGGDLDSRRSGTCARIATGSDAIELGGAVTYTEALPHLDRHFPSFGALVRRIGSRQIRNLGTIAGNLATASPIGDTIACLIALDATVTLASRAGQRSLPVDAFIAGYRKTALAAGEVIAAIRIPLLAPGREFAAYKLSKRFDQDISTVIAAFVVERHGGTVRELRAAYGGMAARAMRAPSAEAALTGRPWTPASLADVDGLLARDFTPIGDHRGSANYRLRAAAGLLRRFQLETSQAGPTRVETL